MNEGLKTIDLRNAKQIGELSDSHKLSVIIQLLVEILSELQSK